MREYTKDVSEHMIPLSTNVKQQTRLTSLLKPKIKVLPTINNYVILQLVKAKNKNLLQDHTETAII